MSIRELTSIIVVAAMSAILTAPANAQWIGTDVVETQNKAFKKWWNTDFEWRFDKLPTTVKIEDSRVPYAGYIYPDRAGGTGVVSLDAVRPHGDEHSREVSDAECDPLAGDGPVWA